MSDPHYTDPRLSDPVVRRSEAAGGAWGWIAGIAVLVLIALIIVAGVNSSSNTASNNPSPAATTGSGSTSPPATTGSGAMSPKPAIPAPAPAPAPVPNGTR